MAERPDFFTEDPTAQDVIDALRLAFIANPERTRPLVETLLEFAPATDGSRGIDLLLRLIAEGTLRVEVAGDPAADHPEEKP